MEAISQRPHPPFRHRTAAAAAAADPVELLVTATHFSESDEISNDDKTKSPSDILPKAAAAALPASGRVWMLYEQRRSDSGQQYIDEGRQTVTLVHDAQDKQDVEIMDADEVSPAIVSLRLCENSKRDDDSEFLRARDRSRQIQ
jgi:hypothetical protein